MTNRVPPTPRPKLTLLPSGTEASPVESTDNAGLRDEGGANATAGPRLDGQPGSNDGRKEDPLGAAMTLVGAAHTTLLEGLRGQPAHRDDWTETRTVVESAIRYLILAQAQRVVGVDVSFPRAYTSLLEVLRQLTRLAQQAQPLRGHECECVWQLARRLQLVVQCLYDWTAKRGIGVEPEEVFALARELQFVYRDLRLLAAKRT